MAAPHFRGLNSLATSQSHSSESLYDAHTRPARPTHQLVTQQAGASSAVPHASVGIDVRGTNNTYTTAAPSAYDAQSADTSGAHWTLPQEDFSGLGFPDSAYAAPTGAWNQLPSQTLPEQHTTGFVYAETLPPRSRHSLTPQIRVTTDLPGFPQNQQPEDNYLSATSVSSAGSFHPATTYPQQYIGHLSPQNYYMNPEQSEMRTPPRSPQTHENPAVGEPITRKRSYSEMSAGVQAHAHSAGSRSRSVSAAGNSPGGDYSPRNRAVKRPDPPMNTENKYICDFSAECSPLTFDRKCEWR